MTENAFIEISAILGIATLLGIVGQRLRQPLIIMFLVAGVLAGPACFGIIRSHQKIELLAHVGIALLLFIVGLKLDLHLIRTTGPVAVATGLGQIIFTSLIGFLIAFSLGMSALTAAYVAVALTFSSTIIIVKLLSDKKEIDSLHGQIAIGFLIVQDIAAILALVGLTTLGSSVGAKGAVYTTALFIIAKGCGFLLVVALVAKYVIPPFTRWIAQSLELLTLFAITWAIFLGAFGEWLGFSKEVGAFLAGVSLASTEFRDSIGARLTGLRDFLLLFFFIDLGARLDWSTVGTQVWPSVVFSLFVLIGNPLIVLIIMGWMGYRRRTALLAGFTVAQISEFSLILAALGVRVGHISNQTAGLITLVGVITIFISTYFILYSGSLYQWLSPALKIFERKHPYRETSIASDRSVYSVDVILVGLGNYGSGLVDYLMRRGKVVLGVDFDPKMFGRWSERGVRVLYGDASDPELHESLPLGRASWVISTVRSKETSLGLLDNLKKAHYSGKIALTATDEQEAEALRKAGAHLVFRPFTDATEQAVDALTDAMDLLPKEVDWPVSFLEVRIKSDAAVAGRLLSEMIAEMGEDVSVLAVSRGGQSYYEPNGEFRIFPGDRLLIMGEPSHLKDAERFLHQINERVEEGEEPFEIAEIQIAQSSALSGKSIQSLRFRQTYKATLIGIRRGDVRITVQSPMQEILGGDVLIAIGKKGAIQALKSQSPL